MSVQRQIDKLIVHRASEWLESIRNDAGENEAFADWLTESPRHMDEFLQLVALSREASLTVREDPALRQAVLEVVSDDGAELPPSEFSHRPGSPAPHRWMPWAAGAAGAAAALAVVALLAAGAFTHWTRFESVDTSQRVVELEDGSVVTLNAKSAILARIDSGERTIRLLTGDALFRVRHDPGRPFHVYTRDAVVQAIGTQFDVGTGRDGTNVAVLEGKVRVDAYAPPGRDVTSGNAGMTAHDQTSNSVPLTAGDAAHVFNHKVERRSSAKMEQITAWRHRRLIFEHTPLEDVIEEFNRYQGAMELQLRGIASGSHHYSGTFDADDVESFVDLLSHEDDLIVERRAGSVTIRSR